MAQPLLVVLVTPSPGSGSGRAPRTPSRTSSKASNAKITTSPYFSTRKRKLSLTSANSTPSKRLTPGTDSDDDEDGLIASSSPVTDRWWEREDPTLFNDPLFCFYFRSFARLYYQLSSVKPLLVQESVAHDPWKLLIAVTLLNKTTGKLAIPVFWDILAKWPTPWALSQAQEPDVISLIRSLGTQSIRAKRLITLSRIYLQDPPSFLDLRPSNPTIPISGSSFKPTSTPSSPSICSPPSTPSKRKRYPPTPISHLPGTGPYALDSYRIFCTAHQHPASEEWKAVMPSDKELIRYLKWKWAFKERKEWIQGIGVVRSVDIPYLKTLVAELATGVC